MACRLHPTTAPLFFFDKYYPKICIFYTFRFFPLDPIGRAKRVLKKIRNVHGIG